MKNISLHTPSLLAGFGLAALVGITMAQTLVGAPGVEVTRVVEPVVVHQPAHPKNFVEVREGQSYTVPSDRLLVITAVGAIWNNANSHTAQLFIDGQFELEVLTNSSLGQVQGLPQPGIVVEPGGVVDAIAGSNYGRAWGYLAEN